MIAGACLSCNRVNQVYKRNEKHCGTCGKQLWKISIESDPEHGDAEPFVKVLDPEK